MRIIGTTKPESGYGSDDLICIISEGELKKVADKAGYGAEKTFKMPKIGDDYNISEGHDFRQELSSAMQKMTEAYKAFSKVAPVAAKFAGLFHGKEPE